MYLKALLAKGEQVKEAKEAELAGMKLRKRSPAACVRVGPHAMLGHG
jgi:hypothetical protein